MPEPGNDRIESFFKKVSGRPDISFNEADWKKLEARLDAKEARASLGRRNRSRSRIAGAAAVTILLMSALFWLAQSDKEVVNTTANADMPAAASIIEDPDTTPSIPESDVSVDKNSNERNAVTDFNSGLSSKNSRGEQLESKQILSADDKSTPSKATQLNIGQNVDTQTTGPSVPEIIASPTDELNDANDTKISLAIADKTKQKANMADSVVMEKNDVKVKDAYGSGLTEHRASPRLSLLLSIAPDFSTVAFDHYTDPGRSIGLTLNYHVKRSWSFSTGVVLSYKKYVGDGEDYTPPRGYWIKNTNGIIPETIDGACNVLEIPLMVQYAAINKGKNRLLVGAGASSYIMLDESYKYNFEQPNPGAKQGWDSKEESALLFNMINVTAGYERRISPGFMIGIEPYLKIPLEGIGWSDMKLFSAGASVTVRYILLNQKNPSAL